MADTREELIRYGMDCALSYNVAERLEAAGWQRRHESEGASCGCGGSYVFPTERVRALGNLRCDACERWVKAESATEEDA